MTNIKQRLLATLSADTPARYPDEIREGVAYMERLEAALKPFADCADLMERNGYVEGLDILARQHGRILGHIGFAWPSLKAAQEALGAYEQTAGDSK